MSALSPISVAPIPAVRRWSGSLPTQGRFVKTGPLAQGVSFGVTPPKLSSPWVLGVLGIVAVAELGIFVASATRTGPFRPETRGEAVHRVVDDRHAEATQVLSPNGIQAAVAEALGGTAVAATQTAEATIAPGTATAEAARWYAAETAEAAPTIRARETQGAELAAAEAVLNEAQAQQQTAVAGTIAAKEAPSSPKGTPPAP